MDGIKQAAPPDICKAFEDCRSDKLTTFLTAALVSGGANGRVSVRDVKNRSGTFKAVFMSEEESDVKAFRKICGAWFDGREKDPTDKKSVVSRADLLSPKEMLELKRSASFAEGSRCAKRLTVNTIITQEGASRRLRWIVDDGVRLCRGHAQALHVLIC